MASGVASGARGWPESITIFAAIHDGITPPAASQALHRALTASSLIWFDTGHWPNLSSQGSAVFQAAAAQCLQGHGVSGQLRRESERLEAGIEEWEAPSLATTESCLGLEDGGCALL